MPIEQSVLSNGVRVLSESIPYVGSAAIGLWCRTGSADEFDNEAGITHLIEHMLFKGTSKRTAHQIAEEIEGRGGGLNAFTDKQATCYYARVLSDDAEIAVDVLSDMMTGSLIEPDELAREIGVVQEEIRRGEDEPSDHVHDLHLQNRWGQHPYGKPIIGTMESVASFKRDDLTSYMDRRYKGGTVMLAAAGKLDHADVVKWAEDRLGGLPSGGEINDFDRPQSAITSHYEKKDVEQVHFCMGGEAPAIEDPDYYASAVLDHILGGGMSSRLFQEVREKRGLAYAIGSYSLNYVHAGAMTIYGGTSKRTWDEVQDVVRKEIASLMTDGPSDQELEKSKRSMSGGIVLALESMSSRMMRMSRNELFRGRQIPLEETVAKIEAVTKQDVIEAARRCLAPELISTTVIGPAA